MVDAAASTICMSNEWIIHILPDITKTSCDDNLSITNLSTQDALMRLRRN